MLKIGIIGAGFIASVHAESINALENAELSMVYNWHEEKAVKFTRKHGGKVAKTPEELIENVDAIVLATPTHVRRVYLEKIFEHKKPVLCEKPLARTLDEGEWIVQRARETGTFIMVGHVLRYFPEFLTIKNIIETGKIGEVRMVRSLRGSSFPKWGKWFSDFQKSGGVILDLAIHEIDFWRWVLGDVQTVQARSLDFSSNITKDHSQVILKFKNGALAHIEATWAYPEGTPFMVKEEVVGSEGMISFDSTHPIPLQIRTDDGMVSTESPYENPYLVMMRDFVRAVEEGGTPPISVEDAFETLRITLKAVESAVEGGKPVEVVKG